VSRSGVSLRALRRGVARDEAAAVLNALTTAVAEFVPSAFAREIACETDALSAQVPRRSPGIREAVAPPRSRAA
jgi:hypothetical protein